MAEEKILKIFLIILSIFFIITVSYNLDIQTPLWSDENLAIGFARNSLFFEFFKGVYSDIHPPLYHLILKLSFTIFGDNVFAARFPSYLFTILTFLLLIKRINRNTNYKFIFFSLLLSSWCIFYYSQEVRPYTLLLFLSTLVYFNIVDRVFYKKENFKFFLIITTFSVLVHYICFFFIIGFYLAELLYMRNIKLLFRKKFIFLFILLLLIILSHIFYFTYQGSRYSDVKSSFFNNYFGNFFLNSSQFYFNNLLIFYKSLNLFKAEYLFSIFLFFSNFITLFISKKFNEREIYFNNLIYFVPLILVLLIGIPWINHYVYIYLLIPFIFYLTDLITFLLNRKIINKKFIIFFLIFYLLVNIFWNFSKMVDHWSGSTTQNGYLNLMAVKEICENYNCYLIDGKEQIDIFDIKKKININLNIKEINREEIDNFKDNESQFIFIFTTIDEAFKKSENYNCFILNNNFFKKIVIFTKNSLIPTYLNDDSYEGISISTANYNRKCFVKYE